MCSVRIVALPCVHLCSAEPDGFRDSSWKILPICLNAVRHVNGEACRVVRRCRALRCDGRACFIQGGRAYSLVSCMPLGHLSLGSLRAWMRWLTFLKEAFLNFLEWVGNHSDPVSEIQRWGVWVLVTSLWRAQGQASGDGSGEPGRPRAFVGEGGLPLQVPVPFLGDVLLK